MSANRPVEVHHISTEFPYMVTGGFMDLFEGIAYARADVALESLHNQANPYCLSTHANTYKYGFSGTGSSLYYNYGQAYEVNDYAPRLDGGQGQWDNHVIHISNNPTQIVRYNGGSDDASANPSIEECRTQYLANTHQVLWQDNIDPDHMTYEELLDLGEAVGTQSRGLSQEDISCLPVTKFKYSFFSRKKFRRERCVICQMNYKRGDRQMTLPCKHLYHASCVSRWLGINKACPVCFAEVIVC